MVGPIKGGIELASMVRPFRRHATNLLKVDDGAVLPGSGTSPRSIDHTSEHSQNRSERTDRGCQASQYDRGSGHFSNTLAGAHNPDFWSWTQTVCPGMRGAWSLALLSWNAFWSACLNRVLHKFVGLWVVGRRRDVCKSPEPSKVFVVRRVIVTAIVTYHFRWYTMLGEDLHVRINDGLARAQLWHLLDYAQLTVVVGHNEVRLSLLEEVGTKNLPWSCWKFVLLQSLVRERLLVFLAHAAASHKLF